MINEKLNNFDEVSSILANPHATTSFIGKKPIPQRPLVQRFKMFATSLMLGVGVSALGVGDFKDLNNQNQPALQVVENATVVENIIEEKEFSLREQYSLINFDQIKTVRDVSKAFIGVNNFIALAAEMEGFRGDLHKDPGVGLNIGFGYNITKRVQENKEQAIKDLTFIGFNKEMIEKIIELSQVPQNQLSKKIREFNNINNIENNQLITLEQGIGLLKITQEDYENQARRAFGQSFDKMGKNQQEVLTYAAYKAGYEALSKYRRAIKAADTVFSSEEEKSMKDFIKIAKELKFYYRKDGKEWVLDERASLIAHTFISQDYLAVTVGANDKVVLSNQIMDKYKIDFSHLPRNLPARPATQVSENIDNIRNHFNRTADVNDRFKLS